MLRETQDRSEPFYREYSKAKEILSWEATIDSKSGVLKMFNWASKFIK